MGYLISSFGSHVTKLVWHWFSEIPFTTSFQITWALELVGEVGSPEAEA